MHGAAQWGFLRFAFEGNVMVLLRKFDPHEVWRTVEREGINNLAITGDAMARPMIEALEELGGPDALDLSSLFVLASTAAIFSPTVKDQYLELFPNLMLIDAIGSLRDRAPTACAWSPRATRRTRAAAPPCSAGARHRRARRGASTRSTRAGVQGRLARRGNVPLEYYKDPEKSAATFVTGPSGDALRPGRRHGDPRGGRHDHACSAAARSASTPAARRSSPRRSSRRSRPTRRCSTPSSSACPTSAGASGWPPWCSPATASRPTLDDLDAHCRGYVAGYKVPKEVHLVPEVVRSPSGKPDYPWAGKVARGEITV